jgi:DNA sulfur modification protein DndB
VALEEAYFAFQAVKGIQANKEYFISMVPLGTIPKLFVFTDEELPPEVRAQRTLNKSRIPEMCNYIIKNPNSYVFSSLTVSVDTDISFTPVSEESPCLGTLQIPMNARCLINDGQHRKAAIEAALKKNPKLKYEHISVVFYHDLGLKKSQQMFSDLNRYAIRPTKSLNILYDDRDPLSCLVREMTQELPIFNGFVEMEKTSISNRSRKLFTLSAIYHCTNALLKDIDSDSTAKRNIAYTFWQALYNSIEEWQAVVQNHVKAAEIRRECICSLGVTLSALGMAGNKLIKCNPENWVEAIKVLSGLDWNKKSEIWSGLVVINDKVVSSKTTEASLARYFEKLFLDRS